jgi:hypothetical protein
MRMNAPHTDRQAFAVYCFFIQYPHMNAPTLPETLRLREDSPQARLPLATAGVERHVWESRFGLMLIEVIDDVVYVNGQRVIPAAASPTPLAAP